LFSLLNAFTVFRLWLRDTRLAYRARARRRRSRPERPAGQSEGRPG